jgi:adenosylcobyric acid synthase
MTAEKKTEQVTFLFDGHECQGYEIHQGVSDTTETVLQTDHCIGTYIHGFLDNPPVVEHLLKDKCKGQSPKETVALSYADFKEEQYNKLAAHVRRYVNMERIYQIISC